MPSELRNLPPLTPDQANVVANMISGYGSVASIAINAGFDPGFFLDMVESPAVKAHLAAARRAATTRAYQRLADAAHSAADVLESIVLDEEHDKVERRRAASTILRTLRRPIRAPRDAARESSEHFDRVVNRAHELTDDDAIDNEPHHDSPERLPSRVHAANSNEPIETPAPNTPSESREKLASDDTGALGRHTPNRTAAPKPQAPSLSGNERAPPATAA